MTMAIPAREATAGRTTEILQVLLVELIDLSLQGKQAHWAVTGPMFKPVHEHLDAIVDGLRTAYDDVAERMAALQVPPDGRLATLAATTHVDPMPAGWQPDSEVVARMLPSRGLAGQARRLDRRARRAGSGEPGLLIGIRHGVDKHAWMLRVQVRGA
jgi:starvation-inducible DNA-binding protein